ncbi:YafY family protein [Actinocrispum sp. NPDC049592]|uniref:helix-turn-helix transcriptional regulator n=1 Tax=Actinocrispum sp. NPDC049592 TaxID=3154835 RepID=UPI003430C8B2
MRAERLVALLFMLQGRRGATVGELAAALGVSERTVHRDVAALVDAGVPLWTEAGRYGGVRLVDGWRTRLDGLTSREAVAIFAMGVPRALAELGLGTAMSAAHAKVNATLPPQIREQAQHMAQRFHLDAPGWFHPQDQAEHLAAVAQAVWEQHRVKVTYKGTVERVLQPLGLVLKAGVWYLVAQVDGTVRTYRVGRIDQVEDLAEPFERPTDFDLGSWWENASTQFENTLRRIPIRVRLSPRGLKALPSVIGVEAAAEAVRHDPGPDGWREVGFALEDPEIAAVMLLGLGTEVEVLEPPATRAAFADAARRMAERHR